jgi:hypothetical protein
MVDFLWSVLFGYPRQRFQPGDRALAAAVLDREPRPATVDSSWWDVDAQSWTYRVVTDDGIPSVLTDAELRGVLARYEFHEGEAISLVDAAPRRLERVG